MIKLLCVDAKGKRILKEGSVYTQREVVTCSCGLMPTAITLEEVKLGLPGPIRCLFCQGWKPGDGHVVYARSRFIQLNDPDWKEVEEKERVLIDK